jgi:hypothetical protein
MKTIIICFLLMTSATSSAQLQHYDSSYTLISSGNSDLLNPVFYKGTESFIFSYENECMMLYEKRNSGLSNIAVRKMKKDTVGSEVMLTNDSHFNTNAAIAHTKRSAIIRKALAVFETRSLGATRLRFAHYSGSSWGDAQFITSDTVQTSSPSVTNLGIDTSNVFLVAYKKYKEIFLRRFENGIWGDEFLISPSDTSRNYYSPEIISNSFNSGFGAAHIAFNYDSSGIVRIMYAIVTSVSLDSLRINSYSRFSQSGSQSVTGFSLNYNFFPVLNFDYFTGNSKKFYSAIVKPPSAPSLIAQDELPGDNYYGSGTSISILTDEISQYMGTSWLNKSGDTTWACCRHIGYGISRFRINNAAQEKAIAISPLMLNMSNYRLLVRIVWNDFENGRYVIKASNGTFDLGSINSANGIADEFELYQNYPNPFNPSTKISYKLRMSGYIVFKIHDIAGREFNSLVNARQNAGSYEIMFPSGNLPSGVYFYSMYIDGVAVASRKMVVLK